MTKYFFLFITLTFTLACGGDTTSTSETTDTTGGEEPIMTTMPVDKSVTLKKPENVNPNAMSPFIGLWAYTKAFTSSAERMDDYNGRWVKFEGDGTFTYGKWQEETNSGEWWVGENSKQIAMDFNDDEEDIDLDWKVNLGGDVIILLGNTDRNKTGDQIQVKKVKELPVK